MGKPDRILCAIDHLGSIISEQHELIDMLARGCSPRYLRLLIIDANLTWMECTEGLYAAVLRFRDGDDSALDDYVPFDWRRSTTDEKRFLRRIMKHAPGKHLTADEIDGPIPMVRAREVRESLIRRGVVRNTTKQLASWEEPATRYYMDELPPGLLSFDDAPTAMHRLWKSKLRQAIKLQDVEREHSLDAMLLADHGIAADDPAES